jgi:DNA-binding PadR family transcriptional regulator
MYPILMRLSDRGLLETAWEDDIPPGRPQRHHYRLSGSGRALAKELASEKREANDAQLGARMRWKGA